MQPYLVANIKISNIEKPKIIAIVSSVPKNYSVGPQNIWFPSVSSILRRTYVPYGFVPPVLVMHIRSERYGRLYHGIVCGCYSLDTVTFSRNIQARDFINSRTISRNTHARASTIIRTHTSARILARTSMCLCVHARASYSIRARAPVSICSRGGCAVWMYVVLPNTLLWGDLGRGSRTDRIYIRGSLGDSL